MRAFLILLAIIVLLMFLGGWMYLRSSPHEIGISVDKQKVQHDTQEALHAGKRLFDQAAEEVQGLHHDTTPAGGNAPAERRATPSGAAASSP